MSFTEKANSVHHGRHLTRLAHLLAMHAHHVDEHGRTSPTQEPQRRGPRHVGNSAPFVEARAPNSDPSRPSGKFHQPPIFLGANMFITYCILILLRKDHTYMGKCRAFQQLSKHEPRDEFLLDEPSGIWSIPMVGCRRRHRRQRLKVAKDPVCCPVRHRSCGRFSTLLAVTLVSYIPCCGLLFDTSCLHTTKGSTMLRRKSLVAVRLQLS